MKNGAYFVMTPNLLAEALRLPWGTEIVGVEWLFIENGIKVYCSHPDLPEVNLGQSLTQIVPTITTDKDGNISCKFI